MSERERSPYSLRGLADRAVAPHRPLLALALLALFLYLPSVWLRDPWNPDEPRYAEVAREMVSRGDYILPHLNGEVYSEKPPLFFWLGILAGSLPGVPLESGPRLVSALAALLTLLLTFHLGRRLIDDQTGWLAALTLATSSMFVIHATSGVIDGTLTLIVTAAIACGLRARQERSTSLWALFYLLLGLAVITKGPVGLAIPAGALVLFSLQEDGARGARALHPVWGILIVAGVAALWLVPAIARGGREYADIILFKQNIGRAYQSWHHREPLHYFLRVFPAAFVPWILLLTAALYEAFRARGAARRGARLPLTWFLFTFLFFTAISGKKTRYLLPLFPAASLLVALELRAFLAQTGRRLRTAIPLGLAAAALSAGGLALAASVFGPAGRLIDGMKDLSPDQVTGLLWYTRAPGALLLVVPGLVVAGLGALALGRLRGERRAAVGCVMIAWVLVFGWTQWVGVPALNHLKSARPLARAAAAVAGPSGAVLLYREQYAGVFNLHLELDVIPVISGPDKVAGFLDGHPGAVVLAGATDLERLRVLIGPFETIHCRRIGNDHVCAARRTSR